MIIFLLHTFKEESLVTDASVEYFYGRVTIIIFLVETKLSRAILLD